MTAPGVPAGRHCSQPSCMAAARPAPASRACLQRSSCARGTKGAAPASLRRPAAPQHPPAMPQGWQGLQPAWPALQPAPCCAVRPWPVPSPWHWRRCLAVSVCSGCRQHRAVHSTSQPAACPSSVPPWAGTVRQGADSAEAGAPLPWRPPELEAVVAAAVQLHLRSGAPRWPGARLRGGPGCASPAVTMLRSLCRSSPRALPARGRPGRGCPGAGLAAAGQRGRALGVGPQRSGAAPWRGAGPCLPVATA